MFKILKELCITCIEKNGLTDVTTNSWGETTLSAGDVKFFKAPRSVEWYAIVKGIDKHFPVDDEVSAMIRMYQPNENGMSYSDYIPLIQSLIEKNRK